jgi:RimJ/RimL family protein N-acetyltransferase
MLTKFRQDLQAKIRQSGLLGAGRWLIHYLASVPYEHIAFAVFSRSLEEPLPTTHPRIPVAMRLATEADLPRFREIVLSSEYQHFARRLAHGRLCFLAFLEENPEELASYCWATTEIDPNIDKLIFDLPSGHAYVDDAYTVPAYRRQGIQTAVHLYRLRHLQTMGCKRAILIVDVRNRASQTLVHKLGYRKVGQTSFLRIMRTIVTPLTIVDAAERAERQGEPASQHRLYS